MMLERFGHGGDWHTAADLFGEREQWLDFSANMNPLGPPPHVHEALRSAWQTITRYPDPAVRELREKLASHHGISPDNILVGNGAAECIDLAMRVLKPRRLGLVRPAFSEYEEAAAKLGCELHEVYLKTENSFVLEEDLAVRLSDCCDTVILGHPNNPTGQLIPGASLRILLSSGSKLIIDEAFLDFSQEEETLSLIPEAARREGLIVIRSMTKFYAIPGLRLGYAVADAALIHEMQKLQVPWSVNAMAQAAGIAALEDSEYAARTKQWLADERPWLTQALKGLGLTVYSGMPNYILFALPEDSPWTAASLQQALGRKGILIRDASHFRGLTNKFVRCAVRDRKDNEVLIVEMQKLLAAHP